ncbi:hypothetical protein CR513_38651, partial [Mucuna pruriens]
MRLKHSSNYGLQIKNMEKILEIKRILEVSLRTIKINILHVEKNFRNENKHQANFLEEHDNEQHCFYATQDFSDEIGGNWYLDSGFSNHMAKDRSIFKDIDNSSNSKFDGKWHHGGVKRKKALLWWRQKKEIYLQSMITIINGKRSPKLKWRKEIEVSL